MSNRSSYKELQEQLDKFIDEETEPSVFAINGKWGVGKTEAWKLNIENRVRQPKKTICFFLKNFMNAFLKGGFLCLFGIITIFYGYNSNFYYTILGFFLLLFGLISLNHQDIISWFKENVKGEVEKNLSRNTQSKKSCCVLVCRYFYKKFNLQKFSCLLEEKTSKDYLYISLFGIENIEEIKTSLISEDILLSNYGFVNGISKIFRFDGVSKATEKIYIKYRLKKYIKNKIICFDDVERSKVDISLFLGFISDLKKEKNCKIVLIFNEEELEGGDQNILSKYHEKVIDRYFEYEPTPEEKLEFAFNDLTFEPEDRFILKNKSHVPPVKLVV